MLTVNLNRLKSQAEEMIAEEQVGLKAGRSTTAQISNLEFYVKSILTVSRIFYHIFTDFKKRIWHATLWVTMRKYNINANLVRAIEHLYDNAISAVQMNDRV